MRSFAGRDILSLKEFERQEFFRVFEVAAAAGADCRQSPQQRFAEGEDAGDGVLPAVSTRTRLAHEAAMHRLGGHVTGFSRRQDDPRRRLLSGVDQGHRQDAGVLRRCDRDAPLPAGRAAGSRQVGLACRSSTAATAGASTPPRS